MAERPALLHGCSFRLGDDLPACALEQYRAALGALGARVCEEHSTGAPAAAASEGGAVTHVLALSEDAAWRASGAQRPPPSAVSPLWLFYNLELAPALTAPIPVAGSRLLFAPLPLVPPLLSLSSLPPFPHLHGSATAGTAPSAADPSSEIPFPLTGALCAVLARGRDERVYLQAAALALGGRVLSPRQLHALTQPAGEGAGEVPCPTHVFHEPGPAGEESALLRSLRRAVAARVTEGARGLRMFGAGQLEARLAEWLRTAAWMRESHAPTKRALERQALQRRREQHAQQQQQQAQQQIQGHARAATAAAGGGEGGEAVGGAGAPSGRESAAAHFASLDEGVPSGARLSEGSPLPPLPVSPPDGTAPAAAQAAAAQAAAACAFSSPATAPAHARSRGQHAQHVQPPRQPLEQSQARQEEQPPVAALAPAPELPPQPQPGTPPAGPPPPQALPLQARIPNQLLVRAAPSVRKRARSGTDGSHGSEGALEAEAGGEGRTDSSADGSHSQGQQSQPAARPRRTCRALAFSWGAYETTPQAQRKELTDMAKGLPGGKAALKAAAASAKALQQLAEGEQVAEGDRARGQQPLPPRLERSLLVSHLVVKDLRCTETLLVALAAGAHVLSEAWLRISSEQRRWAGEEAHASWPAEAAGVEHIPMGREMRTRLWRGAAAFHRAQPSGCFANVCALVAQGTRPQADALVRILRAAGARAALALDAEPAAAALCAALDQGRLSAMRAVLVLPDEQLDPPEAALAALRLRLEGEATTVSASEIVGRICSPDEWTWPMAEPGERAASDVH
jgi:hypothetical protein